MENQSKHTFKETLSALLRSNRRHGRFVQALFILSVLVAVVVPLSMRQSGVAMTTTETRLACHYAGSGAHTHNDDCYDEQGNLMCPLEEKPFHTHTADCYATETVLVCGQAETEGHAHTDACYDEDGNLTCTLAEVPAHTHTDACYETRATDQLVCGLEETTEEHVHGPACFETVTVELSDPESDPEPEATVTPAAEEDPTPAQEFTDVLKKKDENGNEYVYLVVQVKAPQGALPKGSTMSLAHVDLNKKDDLTGLTGQQKLDEALRKEAGDAAAITQTDAVDITFKDSEGNRVDPAKKVEVRVTTANIRTFSDQRTAGDEAVTNNSLLVLHVVDHQHTARTNAPDAEVIRDVALTNQDENDHSTGHEDTVLFEAQEFSAYVVARVDGAANAPTAEVQSETEAQPAETADQPLVEATIDLTAAEDEPEPEQPAAPKAPAQTFSHRFSTASGQDLLVVNVSAPDGAFPLGTTMQVAWVNASQVERAVTKAVSERTDGRLRDLRAVDITFIDADGNEIEPAVPITVTFVSDLIDTADDAHVVHIDDAGRAEVVDSLGSDELKSREIADQADELVFESDAFSTYVVAVTTLHKELAASDGATYDITVDAPAEAGIPQDAELRVSEIARGTAGYEDYLFQALQALGEDASANGEASARFFDIKIYSGEAEIQPQAPVRVSIQLADAAGADSAAAVHFQHSSEERPEVLNATQDGDVTTFDATGFSVYGVIYTVDFEYSVNGNTYQFSLPGGEAIALSDLVELLGIIDGTAFEDADAFVAQVASVTFSDESLVKVTQAEGDWLLESLQPFDTEESLTITMKNGDVLTVKVTDAQQIPDAEKASISADKSYLICYEVNGTYYLLKNDGTVDSAHHPDFSGDPDSAHDFEHLNSTYAWSFNHIFKEQDVEHHLDKNYYLIRPIDHKSQTLTLNNAGEALVQQGNNNVAVIQTEDGFILEGYHNIGTDEAHRYIHLGFDNGAFAGVDGDGVTLHIYEMNSLPTYDYTARSADEGRGSVSVAGGTQRTEDGGAHYYEATSNEDKKNAGTITATPVNHRDSSGRNKWLFDHWELDGLPLDRDEYPATIQAGSLLIPHNDSKLVAYFRQNPAYVVPANEKEPSSVEDMTGWLEGLQNRNIPLDSTATSKTAEVYDYQNRIYRVDLTSKANFETFAGNLDMAFCLDVSNSMYFPSALVETASANHSNPMPIYQINNNSNHKNWLDKNRNWYNPYYLIADASGTATVFKIYYDGTNWKAQDASRTTESDKSFVIGNDFRTNWTTDQYDNHNNKNHPFGAGDNNSTSYMIYDAGDNGKNRFYYLNQSLGTSSTDLNVIAELLAVAGDASPGVNIAYNTFNKNLGSQRRDFQPASSGLTVDLAYSSGGGTRPDQAFNDAQNFNWTADYSTDGSGNTDRYVILVTDGAPQGVRDGESSSINIDNVVRTAARNLKNNSHVKLITVGLSMDSVTSGKQLLYDLADFDNNGNKMFYMAESGSDLENIFRQITKVLMEDAVVLGDITDTVSEGFYLVDKITGLPLKAGDKIDIDGNLTTDQTKVAGVVQPDGKTIKWTGQAIDSVTGWHGTVYVKAQEELLGGNAMNTNSGDATIVATKYRVGGKDVPFDTTLVRDTLNLTANLPSPKVNVNELTFNENKTEWTVYLGEEVDPKQQLKALYDNLVVEEVVNINGGLHYTISPNSIEERWDDVVAGSTAETFSLPGLIERLICKDSTLEAKYFNGTELKWDAFLTDALSPGGITLPYHEYGLTDGSNIKITLEKTIVQGEEDDLINKSPHKTTVTGDGVEKYVFRIAYEPDYTVTPIGQGGQNTADFHTGTFGSMYQGHAAGREASTNEHVINVFAKRMKIEKVDQERHTITHDSATFVLYRKATAEDTTGMTEVPGLVGEYVAVQTLTTTGGTVTTNPLPLLDNNEPYYLVETKAPDGFDTLTEPLKVTIDMTDHNTWTKVADGTTSQTKPDPYELSNWLQEATVKLLKMDNTAYVPDQIVDYNHDNDTTNASVTYQIINNAGVELPEAGGPGTYLHTLCGLALFAAAGYVGIASRRKESEDAA